MADSDWRLLEREVAANPDDRELLERAIRARLRAGELAPLPLLARWLQPELDRVARELKAGAELSDSPAAQALLSADREKQAALLGFGFARLDLFLAAKGVAAIFTRLLRRTSLKLTSDDVLRILEGAQRSGGVTWAQPWASILRQVELCIEREGIRADLRAALRGLGEARVGAFRNPRERGVVATQAKRLIGAGFTASPSLVRSGAPWADAALETLASMKGDEERAWRALLEHALTSKSGRPSKRWLTQVTERVEAVGDECGATLRGWFARLRTTRDQPDDVGLAGQSVVRSYDVPLLRGLVWALASTDSDAIDELAAVAAYAFAKVPERGPRCVPLANACAGGLGEVGQAAIPALEELRDTVVHDSSRKALERALTHARGEVVPRKARRKAKPKPALSAAVLAIADAEDVGEGDRELVRSLAALEDLRPLERVFVDDVKRAVLATHGALTSGQREKARAILARRA